MGVGAVDGEFSKASADVFALVLSLSMKLLVFILAATIQLVAAATGLLILLLVLNGYSESQATPSLILYIILGIGSAVALGFASKSVATRLVEKRSFSKLAASACAVVGSTIVAAPLWSWRRSSQ